METAAFFFEQQKSSDCVPRPCRPWDFEAQVDMLSARLTQP